MTALLEIIQRFTITKVLCPLLLLGGLTCTPATPPSTFPEQPPGTPEWKSFESTTSAVSLKYPDLGGAAQISERSTLDGAQLVEILAVSSPLADPISQIGIKLLPNASHLSLTDWFTQNVDPAGILVANEVFARRDLSNGMQAFVLSTTRIPAEYLDQYGPVDSVYALSPSGATVIIVTTSQQNDLVAFGYSAGEQLDLLLKTLETLQVP